METPAPAVKSMQQPAAHARANPGWMSCGIPGFGAGNDPSIGP